MTFSWLRGRRGLETELAFRSEDARDRRALAAGAPGATIEGTVLFADAEPSPVVIAHELAHVEQRRKHPDAPLHGVSRPSDPAEREADAFSRKAVAGERAEVHAAPSAAVAFAPPPAKVSPFEDPAAAKAAGATAALDAYAKLSDADRRAAFELSFASGALAKVLKAIPPADAAAKYRAPMRELLRWSEEEATRKAAAQTDEQIADAQATFERARAEAEAKKKAAAAGRAPPAAADVERERKEEVAATSIEAGKATTWTALKPAEKARWTADGQAAVTATVALAKAKHPELALKKSDIRVDFAAIEARGVGVVAMSEDDGKGGKRAVVGFDFVETAKINPAYVLSDIVHELHGHPEYGEYGTEYHLALHDKAAAKIPGYVKPVGADRTAELDAYAYQETELYSLMRELPYFTAASKADAAKGVSKADPRDLMEPRLDALKQQWAPRIAVALVRGIAVRFRLDPRLAPVALAAFEAAVKKTFSAAEAKEILAP